MLNSFFHIYCLSENYLKENVKKIKSLLTYYYLCDNIWSENFLFLKKTYNNL